MLDRPKEKLFPVHEVAILRFILKAIKAKSHRWYGTKSAIILKGAMNPGGETDHVQAVH
jgi:hypothetical protein